MGKTIFYHDDFEITFHRAINKTQRTLVISFGSQSDHKSAAGFGTSFLLKAGYDSIYVSQRQGTQYQSLSIENFLDSVSQYTRDRDVVTYGASLGGYAALYYGGPINARIIAAAPRQSAWPRFNDDKWSHLTYRHLELYNAPLSSHNPTIIYDIRAERDARMVNEMILPAYKSARLVKLEYTGHTVLRAIKEAGLLNRLITGIIDRDEVIELKLLTEDCPQWTFNKGRDIISADPEEGRRLLLRSFSLSPDRRPYEILLSSYIRSGLFLDAQHLIKLCRDATGSELKVNNGIKKLMEKYQINEPYDRGAWGVGPKQNWIGGRIVCS